MIKVNKTKDAPTTFNLINFDYFHISQNLKKSLNEDEFKTISWNLFFVKNKIPYFVLDNLGIKYSVSLKEGGNNYVVDSNFPHSSYGSQLIHIIKDVFDPSYLETGYVMHLSSFLRFINFMLPPMDDGAIEIAKDVLHNQDPFKLSIVCSYNIYSDLNAFKGFPKESSNPEYEWLVESVMDGLRYEEELKYYKQNILKDGNKNNK